jgi:outer membrane protein TolC
MQRRLTRRGGIAVPALASLALTSAPAVAQKPPPPAPPPAQADAPAQPPTINVSDPALAPVPPPPRMIKSWKEALAIIASRSADLATAVQEVRRAEGNARQALGAALPQINATGTLNHQLLFQPAAFQAAFIKNPGLQAQIQASMPILAPRTWYAAGTAYKSVDSSKLSVDDKHRTVLAGVADAIVAVYTAERVAEINRVSLKSSLERLDLTQRKFRLGDGTKLDVLRAEQDSATTRATLVTGDESLRQAREALGLALGFREPFGVPPSISLNEIEQAVAQVCSAGTLDQRADIKQSRNDLEIAKRGITDAWLAFAPSASISTTLAVANQTSSISASNATWSLQAVLTVPLWDGGARYGGLKIAQVTAEQAKIKLDATLRAATFEVAQAVRGVAVAEQSRKVSEQSRDLAREAARLAQRAYEVGTGTSFDLVDTAQKQRAAELDLALKEFQLIKARIAALLAASSCHY